MLLLRAATEFVPFALAIAAAIMWLLLEMKAWSAAAALAVPVVALVELAVARLLWAMAFGPVIGRCLEEDASAARRQKVRLMSAPSACNSRQHCPLVMTAQRPTPLLLTQRSAGASAELRKLEVLCRRFLMHFTHVFYAFYMSASFALLSKVLSVAGVPVGGAPLPVVMSALLCAWIARRLIDDLGDISYHYTKFRHEKSQLARRVAARSSGQR